MQLSLFRCWWCCSMSYCATEYSNHLNRCQGEVSPWSCGACQKNCKSFSELMSHVHTHADELTSEARSKKPDPDVTEEERLYLVHVDKDVAGGVAPENLSHLDLGEVLHVDKDAAGGVAPENLSHLDLGEVLHVDKDAANEVAPEVCLSPQDLEESKHVDKDADDGVAPEVSLSLPGSEELLPVDKDAAGGVASEVSHSPQGAQEGLPKVVVEELGGKGVEILPTESESEHPASVSVCRFVEEVLSIEEEGQGFLSADTSPSSNEDPAAETLELVHSNSSPSKTAVQPLQDVHSTECSEKIVPQGEAGEVAMLENVTLYSGLRDNVHELLTVSTVAHSHEVMMNIEMENSSLPTASDLSFTSETHIIETVTEAEDNSSLPVAHEHLTEETIMSSVTVTSVVERFTSIPDYSNSPNIEDSGFKDLADNPAHEVYVTGNRRCTRSMSKCVSCVPELQETWSQKDDNSQLIQPEQEVHSTQTQSSHQKNHQMEKSKQLLPISRNPADSKSSISFKKKGRLGKNVNVKDVRFSMKKAEAETSVSKSVSLQNTEHRDTSVQKLDQLLYNPTVSGRNSFCSPPSSCKLASDLSSFVLPQPESQQRCKVQEVRHYDTMWHDKCPLFAYVRLQKLSLEEVQKWETGNYRNPDVKKSRCQSEHTTDLDTVSKEMISSGMVEEVTCLTRAQSLCKMTRTSKNPGKMLDVEQLSVATPDKNCFEIEKGANSRSKPQDVSKLSPVCIPDGSLQELICLEPTTQQNCSTAKKSRFKNSRRRSPPIQRKLQQSSPAAIKENSIAVQPVTDETSQPAGLTKTSTVAIGLGTDRQDIIPDLAKQVEISNITIRVKKKLGKSQTQKKRQLSLADYNENSIGIEPLPDDRCQPTDAAKPCPVAGRLGTDRLEISNSNLPKQLDCPTSTTCAGKKRSKSVSQNPNKHGKVKVDSEASFIPSNELSNVIPSLIVLNELPNGVQSIPGDNCQPSDVAESCPPAEGLGANVLETIRPIFAKQVDCSTPTRAGRKRRRTPNKRGKKQPHLTTLKEPRIELQPKPSDVVDIRPGVDGLRSIGLESNNTVEKPVGFRLRKRPIAQRKRGKVKEDEERSLAALNEITTGVQPMSGDGCQIVDLVETSVVAARLGSDMQEILSHDLVKPVDSLTVSDCPVVKRKISEDLSQSPKKLNKMDETLPDGRAMSPSLPIVLAEDSVSQNPKNHGKVKVDSEASFIPSNELSNVIPSLIVLNVLPNGVQSIPGDNCQPSDVAESCPPAEGLGANVQETIHPIFAKQVDCLTPTCAGRKRRRTPNKRGSKQPHITTLKEPRIGLQPKPSDVVEIRPGVDGLESIGLESNNTEQTQQVDCSSVAATKPFTVKRGRTVSEAPKKHGKVEKKETEQTALPSDGLQPVDDNCDPAGVPESCPPADGLGATVQETIHPIFAKQVDCLIPTCAGRKRRRTPNKRGSKQPHITTLKEPRIGLQPKPSDVVEIRPGVDGLGSIGLESNNTEQTQQVDCSSVAATKPFIVKRGRTVSEAPKKHGKVEKKETEQTALPSDGLQPVDDNCDPAGVPESCPPADGLGATVQETIHPIFAKQVDCLTPTCAGRKRRRTPNKRGSKQPHITTLKEPRIGIQPKPSDVEIRPGVDGLGSIGLESNNTEQTQQVNCSSVATTKPFTIKRGRTVSEAPKKHGKVEKKETEQTALPSNGLQPVEKPVGFSHRRRPIVQRKNGKVKKESSTGVQPRPGDVCQIADLVETSVVAARLGSDRQEIISPDLVKPVDALTVSDCPVVKRKISEDRSRSPKKLKKMDETLPDGRAMSPSLPIVLAEDSSGPEKSRVSCEPFYDKLCHVCGSQFSRKALRDAHIVDIHLNKRPYACVICSTYFIEKEKLREHFMNHLNPTDYECGKCLKSFAHQEHLLRHMFTHE